MTDQVNNMPSMSIYSTVHFVAYAVILHNICTTIIIFCTLGSKDYYYYYTHLHYSQVHIMLTLSP